MRSRTWEKGNHPKSATGKAGEVFTQFGKGKRKENVCTEEGDKRPGDWGGGCEVWQKGGKTKKAEKGGKKALTSPKKNAKKKKKKGGTSLIPLTKKGTNT